LGANLEVYFQQLFFVNFTFGGGGGGYGTRYLSVFNFSMATDISSSFCLIIYSQYYQLEI